MKICPNCNISFNDTDMFCDSCGAKLENAETVIIAEPENEFPVPKKKGLLWWHILLIVLAVIVVAGVVFAVIYFIGNDDKNPSEGEGHSQSEEKDDDDEKDSEDKTDKYEEGASASAGDDNSSDEDMTFVDNTEVTTVITVKPGDENGNGNRPGINDNGNNNTPVGGNNNTPGGNNNTPGGNNNTPGGNNNISASSVDACINAFMQGKYYMASYDTESGAGELLEMAVNGDNFQINMESEGMEMSIIVINNTTYLANNKGKYISLNALTELLGEEGFETDSFTSMIDMLDVSKYNFTKTEKGTTRLGGEDMNYKKYIASDAELYFYYTSEGIRQIELVTGDETTDFAFVVDSFSATIPSGMVTLSGLQETSVFEFAFDMMQ